MGLLDVFSFKKEMGLFDVFSFKKEAAKVLNKDFFVEILKLAREKIIELAKKNIPGRDKKEQLDEFLILRIRSKIKEDKITNKYVLWLVEKLIEILPSVTQIVYEFLKEKIENL